MTNVERAMSSGDEAREGSGIKPSVEIENLSIQYTVADGSTLTAVRDLSLDIREGEFLVIVGPSGCGKSSVLKCLAGLVQHTAGTASIEGAPAGQPRSDIGYVFQAPTLLPWFTILQNVEVPLRVQKRDKQAGRKLALELLELVGLEEFADRYPTELSGGMQQRAGMARALVNEPSLLLMDEPFGALDALTREQMNLELQKLWLKKKKTVVFVTHGIAEAVFLADRIIVMTPRPGKIAEEIVVDLPRPRGLEVMGSAEFGAYANQVRMALNARSHT